MPNVYIAIDGDNVGKYLEKYIMENNLQELSRFSESILKQLEEFNSIASRYGDIVFSGGDNLMFCVTESDLSSVLRDIIDSVFVDLHFSIGVGETCASAFWALRYAKSSYAKFPVLNKNGRFMLLESLPC